MVYEMWGVAREVARRIYLSRIVEKVNKYKEYAARIGTKNKSRFVPDKKVKWRVQKHGTDGCRIRSEF